MRSMIIMMILLLAFTVVGSDTEVCISLDEGETHTIETDGKVYDIKNTDTDSRGVQLRVNGETTSYVDQEETYTLVDGSTIRVIAVRPGEAEFCITTDSPEEELQLLVTVDDEINRMAESLYNEMKDKGYEADIENFEDTDEREICGVPLITAFSGDNLMLIIGEDENDELNDDVFDYIQEEGIDYKKIACQDVDLIGGLFKRKIVIHDAYDEGGFIGVKLSSYDAGDHFDAVLRKFVHGKDSESISARDCTITSGQCDSSSDRDEIVCTLITDCPYPEPSPDTDYEVQVSSRKYPDVKDSYAFTDLYNTLHLSTGWNLYPMGEGIEPTDASADELEENMLAAYVWSTDEKEYYDLMDESGKAEDVLEAELDETGYISVWVYLEEPVDLVLGIKPMDIQNRLVDVESNNGEFEDGWNFHVVLPQMYEKYEYGHWNFYGSDEIMLEKSFYYEKGWDSVYYKDIIRNKVSLSMIGKPILLNFKDDFNPYIEVPPTKAIPDFPY